jgi:3-dehydroquinate dehydratase-2
MSLPKILLLNGPNLNLLGKREVSIYGDQSFEDYFQQLQIKFQSQLDLYYYQSNTEGQLIDRLHEVGFSFDGIVFNAGAYTHTSLALADAIAGIQTPVVEVHISNVFARETIRHHSYIAAQCVGSISGFGLYSYEAALQFFLNQMTNSE